MNKSFSEIKHGWIVNDIRFYTDQRNFFLRMVIKHAIGPLGDDLRFIIRTLDRKIRDCQREYKDLFGVRCKTSLINE